MLPIDFYEKLYGAVNVLVHPVAFTELNQKSFHHSEKNGKQSSPAGVAGRLDELIFSASTSGLPQKLKVEKLLYLSPYCACLPSERLEVPVKMFFNAGKAERDWDDCSEGLQRRRFHSSPSTIETDLAERP